MVEIKPNDSNSRWVALDMKNKIVAEDKDADNLIKKANQTGKVYSIMYVPKEGQYIF